MTKAVPVPLRCFLVNQEMFFSKCVRGLWFQKRRGHIRCSCDASFSYSRFELFLKNNRQPNIQLKRSSYYGSRKGTIQKYFANPKKAWTGKCVLQHGRQEIGYRTLLWKGILLWDHCSLSMGFQWTWGLWRESYVIMGYEEETTFIQNTLFGK